MSDSTVLISHILIKANGSYISTDLMELLIDAVVEDDLSQPAMFSLRFHDEEFLLIDGTTFKLGTEVTLLAHNSNNQEKPLMTGEVTAIEPEMEQDQTIVSIRGYDKSHRLYRGHKTRSFLKKKDSEIASTIAGECGLSADVQATSITHEYVMQDNMTNMEFLRQRAALNGYRVWAADGKLKFQTGEDSPPEAPAQEWGISLLSFHARLSATAQPNKVEVRSWDPVSKKAVVGEASAPANPHAIGDGKTGGAAAQTAFGSEQTVMVTHQPVRTQGEANALAKSVLNEMAGDYLSAEGSCYGEPAIKAGSKVELKGIGTKFSGKYFVTASRHVYTIDEGYRTTFVVSGRHPNNMVATFTELAPNPNTLGVVVGIVTSNDDKDNMGRVKVKFPWLSDEHASDWARLSTPGAGPDRGLFLLPEVNDEVLVAFEHGDINKPYVVGGLWNGKEKHGIASVVADSKVNLRTLKTRSGHLITFNDADSAAGKRFIEIKTAGGLKINMGDGDKKVIIQSSKHTVTLDDNGTGKIIIESGGELEMKGSQSTLKFSTGGKLELSNPGGKLEIGPSGVTLESKSVMNVKGMAATTVEGQASATVKSSGILVVQGTLVKIN